jgi:NitT/TauT family transport system ATP-binding protein
MKAHTASLRVNSVGITYPASQGPVEALRDVTFDVPPGAFVSVVGPSGCGKTTLLKLIAGLLSPTYGEIHLGGERILRPRRDIGIVFQKPTLLPWKNVLENVLVPIRAMRLNVKVKRDSALSLLKMTGLDGFEGNYPHELSYGMQQRVGIARGLIHDPVLLLMDEPFAALDALTRESMSDELQRIWMATGKSVLFVTHSIAEAVYLSDHIVVMSPRPGRVLRVIEVDLPRPRTAIMIDARRFAEISTELRRLLHETGGA